MHPFFVAVGLLLIAFGCEPLFPIRLPARPLILPNPQLREAQRLYAEIGAVGHAERQARELEP